MSLHIEGMGWIGSALALQLAAHGIEFTWNDNDSPVTAWKATNGVVMPDVKPRYVQNKRAWDVWARSGIFPKGTVTPAVFAFFSKKPPQYAKYKPVELWPGVKCTPPSETTYIVDVPAIVSSTRERFAGRRRDSAPEGSTIAVAHGFSSRTVRLEWGWTAPARLTLPPEAQDALDRVGGLQLYGRPQRSVVAYATSVPSKPGRFLIGTSRIHTPRRHPDTALRHLGQRIEQLQTHFPGVIVEEVGAPVEGWRPYGADPDDLTPLKAGRRIIVPPAHHSGVRAAPEIIGGMLKALKVTT
ncbi:hypothetical protein [Brevibacterium moorei]|uniref:hypothetical protein n=1 Tax=Brevibacterium moorei TaxID=2968457 RepID=UPI00211CC0B0|nr:hypothetical protein [Brevibacterium sp. 68QC2CO]MCQ9384422.1 hypothetical protein [Brevibacterium sp. 68QC2CO]